MSIFKRRDKIESITNSKRAIVDMDGATCTSCVYTIEHVAKKLQGIESCEVNRETSQIQVVYDGRTETLNGLVDLVERIGYSAAINDADIDGVASKSATTTSIT